MLIWASSVWRTFVWLCVHALFYQPSTIHSLQDYSMLVTLVFIEMERDGRGILLLLEDERSDKSARDSDFVCASSYTQQIGEREKLLPLTIWMAYPFYDVNARGEMVLYTFPYFFLFVFPFLWRFLALWNNHRSYIYIVPCICYCFAFTCVYSCFYLKPSIKQYITKYNYAHLFRWIDMLSSHFAYIAIAIVIRHTHTHILTSYLCVEHVTYIIARFSLLLLHNRALTLPFLSFSLCVAKNVRHRVI